jgi:hypothetical protein
MKPLAPWIVATALAVAMPALASMQDAKRADFGRVQPSRDARRIADWAVGSGDNRGLPFAIIDKRNAHVFVFAPGGQLRGHAPVLLGMARGDDTVPGIGEREFSQIQPHERTTPAGRFVAEPGRNMRGENVIWVDYEAAVSMHRVLTTNPAERRPQRLATPTVKDNRISYGCVNVPAGFFENVLLATLGGRKSVVYVLPDVKPLEQVFRFNPPAKPPAA